MPAMDSNPQMRDSDFERSASASDQSTTKKYRPRGRLRQRTCPSPSLWTLRSGLGSSATICSGSFKLARGRRAQRVPAGGRATSAGHEKVCSSHSAECWAEMVCQPRWFGWSVRCPNGIDLRSRSCGTRCDHLPRQLLNSRSANWLSFHVRGMTVSRRAVLLATFIFGSIDQASKGSAFGSRNGATPTSA
jgi:hypothetical protein